MHISDGRQTASFGGANVALAIAVQPDGKVILAGYNRTSPTTSDFEVARFTAGMGPDTSEPAIGSRRRQEPREVGS